MSTSSTEDLLALARLCREFGQTYALKPEMWQEGSSRIIAECYRVDARNGDDLSETVRRESATLIQIGQFAAASRFKNLSVYCYCEAVGCCDAIVAALARRIGREQACGSSRALHADATTLLLKTHAMLERAHNSDRTSNQLGKIGVLEAAYLAYQASLSIAATDEERAFVTTVQEAARNVLASLHKSDCRTASQLLGDKLQQLAG